MTKITFENLPGTNTPVNADNLNDMQDNIEDAIDGVVESGSNTNGNYVKFLDGTMICYGFVSASLTRTTSMTAGGYRTSGQSNNFPAAFISVPRIVITDVSSTGTSNGCSAASSSSNPSVFSTYWWGINSNSTAISYSASYIAIGKWK